MVEKRKRLLLQDELIEVIIVAAVSTDWRAGSDSCSSHTSEQLVRD